MFYYKIHFFGVHLFICSFFNVILDSILEYYHLPIAIKLCLWQNGIDSGHYFNH